MFEMVTGVTEDVCGRSHCLIVVKLKVVIGITRQRIGMVTEVTNVFIYCNGMCLFLFLMTCCSISAWIRWLDNF